MNHDVRREGDVRAGTDVYGIVARPRDSIGGEVDVRGGPKCHTAARPRGHVVGGDGDVRGRAYVDIVVDVNDASNRGFLPHRGRHPNEYHEFVLRNMKRADLEAAGDQNKFLLFFEQLVKQPVRDNPGMLIKDWWL